MLKRRVIPTVLMRNGTVVQSKQFNRFQALGAPRTIIERLSGWAADELILLDISSKKHYDIGRDDTNYENLSDVIQILNQCSKSCFMPLTFGGHIRTLKDIEIRILNGADKVCLNSWALDNPDMIEKCAREFGSQCIVISIDVDVDINENWEVKSHRGKQSTGRSPTEWATEVASRGAGEILLNSIYNDGTGNGYDLDLLNAVCTAVKIPVIALGGVGSWDHFSEALAETRVSAVAAANIFNYSENSVFKAKKYLTQHHRDIRSEDLIDIF